MKNFEIKITGSGTSDSIACRLIDIARDIQVKNVYDNGEGIEGEYENETLFAEITED